ncbi:MAG: metal ABC transporter permease [Phycisphaerales bacterium]|nr:metal ABC transporter permease [Phycisphaerales bacterium]
MSITAAEWWMIVTAVLACVPCALLGALLVLRRMALLGDAISHAVLPGIVGAFILSATRNPYAMLAGAMVTGLLTAWFTSLFSRYGRVSEDASLGVVFTTMFALGVVMLRFVPRGVDMDPSCVLYGLLEFTGLRMVEPVAGLRVPEAAALLAPVAVVAVLFVTVFFRRIRLISFDPALARSLGISVGLLSAALLTLTAASVVASFQAVGSILVVAMLVTPGATAQLLTTRLWTMLVLSCVLAITAAVGGCLIAIHVDSSAAGWIGVFSGVQFALAAIFSPGQGLLLKRLRALALRVRIEREDLLATMYRREELRTGQRVDLPDTSVDRMPKRRSLITVLARRSLRRGKLLLSRGKEVELTSAGRAAAAELVRRHRLWERFLSDNLALPLDHLHEPAHRLEHFADPERLAPVEGMDVNGAQPHVDPHGRPIPRVERDQPRPNP